MRDRLRIETKNEFRIICGKVAYLPQTFAHWHAAAPVSYRHKKPSAGCAEGKKPKYKTQAKMARTMSRISSVIPE